MIVTKESILTGKINSMDLDVTLEQIAKYEYGGSLVQNIFPNLTPPEREFLRNGITPEEWDKEFGDY